MTEQKEKTKKKTKVKQSLKEKEKLEELQEQNIEKIHRLIQELNRVKHNGPPDIRICPKCFSLRVKRKDILADMGIDNSFPVYYCMDCGWRSKKWIYLDRHMTAKERNKFVEKLIEEKTAT
ncbi:MAG: hypothetical protein U9O98_01150 [Asgard group archaeon]|nr:hypothetical protein [Asgard group archaeon]